MWVTVPDLMHKTVGYRYWRVSEDGADLESPMISRRAWRPGANQADCYGSPAARARFIGEQIGLTKAVMALPEETVRRIIQEGCPIGALLELASGLEPTLLEGLALSDLQSGLRARANAGEDWPGIGNRRLQRLQELKHEAESGGHVSPMKDCQCGFYSWHSLSKTIRYAVDMSTARDLDVTFIVGLVSNWGKMEVYRDGVRSQHSQVMALCRFEEAMGAFTIIMGRPPRKRRTRRRMHMVAKAYGVPLLDREGILALGDELGGPVPESLRPDTGLTDHQ